ncbi:MAG: CRISPR-associated protein Csx11 [Methanosarcinales archaeon]|nr:MAG: CRISPR-associated protein Csx11 [Methanosarcinales archaeon]
MTADLKILTDKQDDLLLAEVAAWLHDMGKCSDEMIERQASDKPQQPIFRGGNDYKIHFSHLLGSKANCRIVLNGENVTLKDLIEKGMPKAIRNSNESWIIRFLGRCHAAAHIEKEGQADAKQTINDTRLSSPFGYETKPLIGITSGLKGLPFGGISNRSPFLNDLKKVFKNAPGDTERPINEVDLWDWSSIVAALCKSALAGELLGNKTPNPNDLRWRLLAIRFDSEQIWGTASKMPILNARKRWVTDGLDNVKNLFEEEYPLGNEVYRDENGSIFVVPDIQDLVKMRDSKKDKTLEEVISETLGYKGEIVITPSMDTDPWWGQDPKRRPNEDKIPPIGEILSKNPRSPPDATTVKQWWDAAHGNPEMCTISWLRPQGPTKKGLNRKASDHWAEKVTGRAEEWLRNRRDTTIWIDEATDTYGRICLITGKLDISDWLKPDGHIKTLLVKPPDASNKAEPKTPSFARIRRIWTTTKTFWVDVTRDLQENIDPAKRLKITGEFIPENSSNHLTKFSAYEAELDEVRFSIFHAGGSEYIITDNLQRLAEKMDVTVERLKAHIDGKTLCIYDSEGKNRQKPIGHLAAPQLETEAISYLPAIPILSEPSIFMAIVPADKALKVANHIKEKYEKEMGKVRNRLPLTLGMVFAKSHTPLAALMDAGRRMLQQSHEEEDWTLYTDAIDCGTECILNFTNKQTWHIPVKMGDKTTDDIWYPYFYVNGVPTGRSTAFKSINGWLVHARELKKGDTVKICPSRFDFEFLDSASRRFEISYDQETGKRRDILKSERPYLLEELEHFRRLRGIFSEKKLARTQIKNMIGLIETKREEWSSKKDDDIFRRFVHDVLHNANWNDGIPSEIEELEDAAVSGKLRDIVELYMDIIKNQEESK